MGDTAPEFTITTDNGRTVSPPDFGGKLLVLNFWATWCPPCVQEMPSLNQFQKSLADKGVVVLGISVDKDEKAYKAFLAEGQRLLPHRARSAGQDQRRLRHLQVPRNLHHRHARQGAPEVHRRPPVERREADPGDPGTAVAMPGRRLSFQLFEEHPTDGFKTWRRASRGPGARRGFHPCPGEGSERESRARAVPLRWTCSPVVLPHVHHDEPIMCSTLGAAGTSILTRVRRSCGRA